MLAVAAVGAALAVLAVPLWVLRDWDSTPEGEAFVSTPEFILWLLILSAQAAVWLAAAVFVFATLRRRVWDLRRRGVLPARAIASISISALTPLLVAAFLLFASRLGFFEGVSRSRFPTEWPLADHDAKMRPLVGTAFVLGALAIGGMWLTSIAFLDLARRARPRASSIRRFVMLRSELTALLAVAGALVGLATLSSGALREAVLATNDEPLYRQRALACLASKPAIPAAEVRTRFDELLAAYPECEQLAFDRGYVLAYGLFFTGILAIAFVPSFLAMRTAGTRLRDCTYPLPNPRDPRFFDVVANRRSFDDLLQTNLSATATVKAGVAIVTPLAASLVSTLVPS